MQRCRVNSPGHGHRHQTQREAQCDQHQQFQPKGRVHNQDQLPQHQAQVGSDHITAEHDATLLGFRLLIQPALDDHVLAHHAQAHDHPQEQPGGQPIDQPMTQHRRTDDPGTGGISADMPDPRNQPMADFASQHQAEVVGSHQRTHP